MAGYGSYGHGGHGETYPPPHGESYPPPQGAMNRYNHSGGHHNHHHQAPYPPPHGRMNPFTSLVPSTFPPGTDPNLVACYYMVDEDRSGLIDDRELKLALSSSNQNFSMRTIHLLMHLFTHSNVRQIGPREFTSVYYCLQSWKEIFERFDRDGSGMIDAPELREALLSLGFNVSPMVLDLLVAKFERFGPFGGATRAIDYDNFIECGLIVKGLTEKFKEKDRNYSGSAHFGYDDFMLTVLPFLIA